MDKFGLYCKIMALIKRAELTAEYSPKDVLLIFSKVMKISIEGFEQITEVPKKVRELEGKINVKLFPKLANSSGSNRFMMPTRTSLLTKNALPAGPVPQSARSKISL